MTLLGLHAAVRATGVYEPSDLERSVAAVLVGEEVKLFMSKPTEAAKAIQADLTSAEQVAAHYNANEVAADKKFFGKKVLLLGTVTSIKSGLRNAPYLVLRGKGYIAPQASLIGTSSDAAAKLQRGDHVALVCFGNGSIIGTPMFKDCRLAQDVSSEVEGNLMRSIDDFLAGRSKTSFFGAFKAVEAVALAQALPANSGCPSDYARCLSQLKALKADQPKFLELMRRGADKLKASGLDFSAFEAKR
nr:OB-fold putative lipoprotein [Achromobacter sp. DH1f]